MRRVARFALARITHLAFGALALACGTLGGEGGGDRDLPSAGVGPFRKLGPTEQHGVPPYVLDDKALRMREPAIVALGDATSTEVALFVTGVSNGHDAILRSRATDARTFFGTSAQAGQRPRVVLEPTRPWEGGSVGGPSVVRDGADWWLFYAAAGGIGRARSSDGLTFASDADPVLALPGARAPSVTRTDAGWSMLYAKDGAIWEATSADGARFATVPGGPVLAAAPPPDHALVQGEKPPFDGLAVDDPCAAARVTVAGRVQFRVLYTGWSVDPDTKQPVSAIGFAARWGTTGPLTRNASPVLAIGKGERAPALFEWTDASQKTQALSMLYVQMDHMDYPSIGGAVAPVDAKLADPSDFPAAP